MKPRPGVPFSWYYIDGISSRIALRKTRLSRQFHEVDYYSWSNNVWVQRGGWSNVATREYLGRYYGLALFRSQDLLIKYVLRCKTE